MNQKDILNTLGDIDPALVPEPAPKKRNAWKIPVTVAACLVLVLGGAMGLIRPWELRKVDLGGMTRLYRSKAASAERALIFPWEYQPAYERYHAMTLEGRPYRTRANTLSPALVGEALGTAEGFGYDIYTEATYTQSLPVYIIRGIDPELLVAVALEGQYYVYMRDSYDPPATLGEFWEEYDLSQTLSLSTFSLVQDHTAQGHYRLTGEDSPILELLQRSREAEYAELELKHYDPKAEPVRRISFTVTSEPLGIYKKSFRVSSDGWLDTNIAEYGYAFYIGEEVAEAIIGYALENSQKTEPEPYSYTLCGTVTEIGEDYFLLDDGILAAGDGMVFRVSTEDLRIRRWLEFGGIGVGDLISVSYSGGIEDGTVVGAYTLSEAFLTNDGHVLIPE